MVYLLGFLAAIAVFSVTVLALAVLAQRRAQAKFEAKQRTVPVEELAAQAVHMVALGGWENIPQGAALKARKTWTDRELLEALEALWSAVCTTQDASYSFADLGLTGLVETLEARLGAPNKDL